VDLTPVQTESRSRRIGLVVAACLLVSLALAGRAIAKCANYSVQLHPIAAVDQADTCVTIPCRVSVNLASDGTLWDIAVLDPDGRLRIIYLRELDQ